MLHSTYNLVLATISRTRHVTWRTPRCISWQLFLPFYALWRIRSSVALLGHVTRVVPWPARLIVANTIIILKLFLISLIIWLLAHVETILNRGYPCYSSNNKKIFYWPKIPVESLRCSSRIFVQVLMIFWFFLNTHV